MTSRITIEPPLDSTQALREASRCLQCFDAPCAKACPAGIVIPRFIRMIRSGNIRGAAEVVRSANPMALSCGIACPDEQLCAAACIRAAIDTPILIRRLHRFANDHEEEVGPRSPAIAPKTPACVAIVGGGPAGLACAFELRRRGVAVTLFEGRDRLGGVLSSTIPLYRFPEKVIQRDAAWTLGGERASRGKLAGHGKTAGRGTSRSADWAHGAAAEVEVKLQAEIADIESLAVKFDAVFAAPGLVMQDPNIPGSDLRGVVDAAEFLAKCRKSRYAAKVGPSVVVIGGGNVAVDAAMAAVRCGEVAGGPPPKVSILYRRGRAEMPAWEREVSEAERAGVEIEVLSIPVAFIGARGRLTGIRVCRAVLGPEDESGRRSPAPIHGSEHVVPCDAAILATGMRLDRRPLGKLPATRDGLIKTDGATRRVRGNIFAGGDVANPAQTIVAAVRDGKTAAAAIFAFLSAGRKSR